jgi:hypothetical protein
MIENPSKKIPLQTNLSHKRNRATELVSKREKQISADRQTLNPCCKRELEKDDEERRRWSFVLGFILSLRWEV